MTTPASRDGLSLEQIGPWLDLLKNHVGEAQDYYFQHLLPDVIARCEADPDNRRIRDDRVHTLISLMGFSPETTVISAAVVRPQRLVIVCGESENEQGRVDTHYNRAVAYLVGRGILTHYQIEQAVINPIDPVDIYTVIRSCLARTPSVDDNRSALVDVTGGKKVMSATAGQAAWEVRIPLCYIEGRYDPDIRRPRPGTERVIKLLNPSEQEQVQFRINALRLYENRNFPEAVAAFEICRGNRVENRLDEFAIELCLAYARWTDLDLPKISKTIDTLRRKIEEPRIRRLFAERKVSLQPYREHFDALGRVAAAEPLAMIATYQELADVYRSDAFQRYDFACLLAYRGMEALVEYGLKQIARSGFDLGHPNYALLGDPAVLAAGYLDLSRRVDRGRFVEADLPRKIGFSNGLALLCVAVKVHDAAGMRDENLVKKMREVAKRRNESVLAHGSRTLGADDYAYMADAADLLTRLVLGAEAEQLGQIRAKLRPLDIALLHDHHER